MGVAVGRRGRVVLTCACVGRKGFRLVRGPGPRLENSHSTVIHIALKDVYADSLRVGRNNIPHTIPKVAIKRRVINVIRRAKHSIGLIGPNSQIAIGIRAFYKRYFFYQRECIGGYTSPGKK